jgi:hypothetical protein
LGRVLPRDPTLIERFAGADVSGGLDPHVHLLRHPAVVAQVLLLKRMDARVKPAHDNAGAARNATRLTARS